MLTPKQEQLLKLLKKQPCFSTHELEKALHVSRARINQLIHPLVHKKMVKRSGRARATTYSITDKRSLEQIRRENWCLRNKVKELEKVLEDRKVIERAKEIIMAQFDVLPTEAYRKLQEQSMDSGRSMRKIAEGILAAYELEI